MSAAARVAIAIALCACRDSESTKLKASSHDAPAAITPSTSIPFIPQQTASDCGVAAIAMTLRVYGRPTDLGAVKQAMKSMNIDPTQALTALDLVNFARRNGLGAAGVRLAVGEVRYLQKGDILWFYRDHFVVFDHVESGHVHVVDPAEGPRALDPATFTSSFSGIALVFTASGDAEQLRTFGP